MTSSKSVDRREAPFAIELEGVGKRYWKLEEQAMLLRSLLPFTRPKRTELWALRNLDVKVEPGETLTKGPFEAETVPVSVEQNYVVITV